jgi:hypothetical protein
MTPPTTTASQQLAEALANEIPETRIAHALSDAMSADLVNRDGSRSPDHRVRLAALQLHLAYTEGKPIERQQIVTQTISSDPVADIAERLARSPSLRKSLAAMLAKVEGEDKSSAIDT